MIEEVKEHLKTSSFVNFHHTSWYLPCTHSAVSQLFTDGDLLVSGENSGLSFRRLYVQSSVRFMCGFYCSETKTPIFTTCETS
jgi:hypothetical protein